MFNIAVCDDEKMYLEIIVRAIRDILQKKGITAYEIVPYILSTELYEDSRLLDYDVIFLDINMPEINGLEVARKIREINAKILIVFISSYMDYAVKCYQLEATRYILKNELQEMLPECIDTIVYKLAIQAQKREYSFLEGNKSISIDGIYYIESQKHKLIFYVMEKNMAQYCLLDKLDNLEKELEPYGFIRIHKSFLVNSHYIKKIRSYCVTLVTGKALPIPKNRFQKVKERFYEIKGELR